MLIVYTLILGIALAFDLLTDKSFGGLMLSSLPIALLAGISFIVSPWMVGQSRKRALKYWIVGTILVLLISLVFAALGDEQAKTGELIFTYAVLIISLPGSLLLPFAETHISSLSNSNGGVFFRIGIAWAFCVLIGGVQLQAVAWLFSKFKTNDRST